MDRSLFIARVVGAGWGGEDFRGDHFIITRFLGERKWEGWRGRVSRNLEPKRGITENFGSIQRGTTQMCLENEDMVGGIAKVIKSY